LAIDRRRFMMAALASATLLAFVLVATGAQAQQSDDPAYDFKLGDVDHFKTETEASEACKGEPWSGRTSIRRSTIRNI